MAHTSEAQILNRRASKRRANQFLRKLKWCSVHTNLSASFKLSILKRVRHGNPIDRLDIPILCGDPIADGPCGAMYAKPAGRCAASLGQNLHGDRVLWIDDDSGVALHPDDPTNPSERRGERLSSSASDDNRITYGCLNVDTAFFEKIVVLEFLGTTGIVFILPEVSSIGHIFGAMATEFLEMMGSSARSYPAAHGRE